MKRKTKTLLVGTVVLTLVGVGIASVIFFNARPESKRVTQWVGEVPPVSDPRFPLIFESLLGRPVLGGNAIEPLEEGEVIYAAMLEAIASAERTITFETYEFWGDEVAGMFSEALAERARAGVKVYAILDFIGSTEADAEHFDRMTEAGVKLIRWREPSWYQLSRFNHRTHRKLLVLDGALAFTGGANTADAWIETNPVKRYRDVHFRIQGPVVNQLQAAFLANWTLATGEVLVSDDYFPLLDRAGDVAMQTVISSPEEGHKRIRTMLLLAIAAAESRIRITTAFLYPDPMMKEALIRASERGVQVEILAPGEHMPKQWVRYASRNRWGPLLEAGVQIYEYQPTKYHAKMYIIDDMWASVGSANFDNRSFRINDETNVNIFDAEFARTMAEIFRGDRANAVEYDLEQWQARPWLERTIGLLGNMIGPHL